MKKLIQCKKCGAEFENNKLICPYCGAENEKRAIKEQKDYVNSFKKKEKELKNVPENAVKKAGKATYIAAAVAIALFVLIMVIAGVGIFAIKVSDNISLKIQERNLIKLEQLYDAGNYEEMGKLLDKISDSYSYTYEKYSCVDYWYFCSEYYIEWMENYSRYIEYVEFSVEDVEEELGEYFFILADIKAHEEKGYVYDEEKAATEIRDKMVSYMKKYMYITDEEIANGVEIYDDEVDYHELAKLLMERMEASYGV